MRTLLLVASLVLGSLAHADAPPPKLRLPAGVRPTHYALDLTVVPAQPTFTGRVTIDLVVDTPTDVVWLDATDLTIDGAELAGRPARIVPGGSDFVGFAAPAPLPRGKAQLTVRWHGTLDAEKSRGLYRVAEANGAPRDDDWYAYTFFEPTDARRAFPCFDEPAYKVPWQLTLHVKKGHAAVANAPVERESDEPGGMKAVRFADSKPLPSYLVAFVVGPFDIVDDGRAGRAHTPIRFVLPRGRAAELRYAKEVTPRILVELERFFDMPYPFEKLDVAVVPRFWGTMEHPGLVALGQPLTLIKPAEEGLQRKQFYANIAIHELAHYWFGDLVTCKWWDDVWLNESLGSWADGHITDALEPAWKFTLGRHVASMQNAMALDAQPTAQRMRLPVEDADAIQNSFDNAITYEKGSALLDMLMHWVGNDKFMGAVRGYLRAHAWGVATEDDFVAALVQALGAPVGQVMHSFVEQPGVPIVGVTQSCNAGKATVTLTQKRFFAAGDRAAPNQWKVPVCLKWDGGRQCVLLESRTQQATLPSCPRWLMANEDAAGYYHVAWDEPTLRALQPAFATLSVRERASVASDVAAEAAQGTLPLPAALALLPTLLGDPDPRVLAVGARVLALANPRELGDAERAAYGRAVAKLLGPHARAVGWAPAPDEDPALAHLRPMLLGALAQHAHDPAVLAQAKQLADKWLRDRRAVAPDMVQPILGMAALTGDAALFDRFLAEAKRVSDRRERGILLHALGAFPTPPLEQRALALLTGPDFDIRESEGVLYRALEARVTREAAWSFLRQHFDAILGRLREDQSMWLFSSVPPAFCDEAHRAQIETFLRPRAQKHPGAPHALDDALELEKTCEASLARNRDAIRAFLATF